MQGSCTAPNRTGEEMISENCAGSDVTVKTESNNSTKYIVSEGKLMNPFRNKDAILNLNALWSKKRRVKNLLFVIYSQFN